MFVCLFTVYSTVYCPLVTAAASTVKMRGSHSVLRRFDTPCLTWVLKRAPPYGVSSPLWICVYGALEICCIGGVVKYTTCGTSMNVRHIPNGTSCAFFVILTGRKDMISVDGYVGPFQRTDLSEWVENSGNYRHRFSAFWLRSKCSICSYQLNI